MSDPIVPPSPPQQGSALPEPLQGKTPEQVYDMLVNEHNRIMAEQAVAKPPEKPKVQEPQVPTFQPPVVPAAEPANILQEPERFVQEQFNQRVQPLIDSVIAGNRELSRQNLVSQVGKEEYETYKEEIEKVVSSLDPRLQVSPNAYMVAFKFVQASHLDDVVSKKAESLAEKKVREAFQRLGMEPPTAEQPAPQPRGLFQQAPAVASPRPFNPQQNQTKLSAAEKAAAKAMDLTEEEFVAYKSMNTDAISQLGRG